MRRAGRRSCAGISSCTWLVYNMAGVCLRPRATLHEVVLEKIWRANPTLELQVEFTSDLGVSKGTVWRSYSTKMSIKLICKILAAWPPWCCSWLPRWVPFARVTTVGLDLPERSH